MALVGFSSARAVAAANKKRKKTLDAFEKRMIPIEKHAMPEPPFGNDQIRESVMLHHVRETKYSHANDIRSSLLNIIAIFPLLECHFSEVVVEILEGWAREHEAITRQFFGPTGFGCG